MYSVLVFEADYRISVLLPCTFKSVNIYPHFHHFVAVFNIFIKTCFLDTP